MQRGAFGEAKAICAEALARNPHDGEALFLLGNALARSGDVEAARTTLERANAAAPGNALILNSLGGAYGASGRHEEAIKALNAALAIDPRFPWARQNLALAFKNIGDFASARRNFELALEVYPAFPDALSGLADILLIYGDVDSALRLADRAIQFEPQQLAARLVQADGALRKGKPQQALDLLHHIEASATIDAEVRARVLALRGRACERLKKYEAAFECYAAANCVLREHHRPTFENGDSVLSLRTIAALTNLLRETNVATWSKVARPPARTPAFILGFPRSGTTLLDQILSAHPGVETLEESMNFSDALTPLILADGALARWSTLTEGEIEHFRRAYWRRAETALARPPRCLLLIDKLPLNTVLLPLIHLLFPYAKIVFAVRDPRDVVISCFAQQFQMNVAMFQFLTLETAARYYEAVMRLGEAARSRLPLDLHMVRYEDLVADFDGTVANLLEFLNLPWHERVRDYHELARTRLIRTPSAEQVRQPIYRSSTGRWRRYQRQVAPLEPTLREWIGKFGYA